MNSRSFILAALIGGAIGGVLANFPVLNLINCILCSWILLGTFLAPFFYRRFQHGEGLTIGQGAGIGAVAGLFAVLIGSVVYALGSAVTMPMMRSLAQMLNIQGNMPWDTGGYLGSLLASSVVFFCLNLVLYPLFGCFGGMIGAAVFKGQPAVQVV